MSKTLTDIQTSVRIYSRDGALDITTAGSDGLNSANRIYRQFIALFPWPEFRRVDTSLTTTANTEEYDWIAPSVNKFMNVISIEVQDESEGNKYKLITKPPDEWTWNESSNKPKQSVPDHYMRFSTNIAQRIALRPSPLYSSKIIRVTGIVEPEEFVGANSKTQFNTLFADDAFEYFLSASWVERDGDIQFAQILFQKSITLLQNIFDKDTFANSQISKFMNPPTQAQPQQQQ